MGFKVTPNTARYVRKHESGARNDYFLPEQGNTEEKRIQGRKYL